MTSVIYTLLVGMAPAPATLVGAIQQIEVDTSTEIASVLRVRFGLHAPGAVGVRGGETAGHREPGDAARPRSGPAVADETLRERGRLVAPRARANVSGQDEGDGPGPKGCAGWTSP